MRLNSISKSAIIVSSLWLLVGCSSQQQQEELEATEPVQTEEVEEIDPAAADEPVDEPIEELEPGADGEDVGEAVEDESASDIGGGLEGLTSNPPGLTSPPSDSAPAAGRVVRYVKSNDAPIFSGKDAQTSPVATLSKGDRVVVTEEGEWARINATHYVQSKYLSKKGVGRDPQKSQWQRPDGK